MRLAILLLLATLAACSRGGGGGNTPPPVQEPPVVEPPAPPPTPEPPPPPPPPPTSSNIEWLTADAVEGQVCPVDQSGFRIYPVVDGIMRDPIVVPFNASGCVDAGTGTCGQVWRCSYVIPAGDYQITGYDSLGIESVPSPIITVN